MAADKASTVAVPGAQENVAAGPKLDSAALTLCLIDGDANFFARDLILNGEVGGAQAAQKLIGGLASAEAGAPPRGAQTWTLVFLDKAAARAQLVAAGACTPVQFDGFCAGFDAAFALFNIVDAGTTADSADKKVKEYLRTFARASNIRRVFVCGHPERPYRMVLRLLQHDAATASKLTILRGSYPVSEEVMSLTPRIPVHKIPRLFELAAHSPPRSPPGLGSNVPSWRSLASPTSTPSPNSPGVQLDPKVPMSKQNPPPCNWFYLARCNKPADKCQYSHYYTLTREQIEDMRERAKRSPCMTTARNGMCPSGDKCILGHVCPNGPSCKYLAEGKCKFTGLNMHAQA
ncbi:hypothetical protein EXIGLDRAFT_734523 [Exidia glandulosa HHB12029]|uniref:C3H1-type domain-containing protein n=1 Tax=Exidia glandulosa HHB12029 TaxID=1314781 RepID=A0A165PMS2_EXIGL|nr:hypothetical protein EXIGLDRAFT_734523 [Exidia glandulosa HHB12029]